MASIGAGGMGEVYRAHDPRLRRDVALKVLRPSLATPEYVQRLSREARAAGSLNHPNILAVFDVGTEGAVPYVVSELLEGESLRQRLDRGPIPFRKSLEYGVQIAHALAAAHEKDICHRDVKPGNVFITTDGRVKLLDFGLAKLQRAEAPEGMDDSTATQATRPMVIRGTAGYMAPEQILGEPVDARTDIFALGAVLYEMFTNRRAFHRASTAETQDAVLNEDPPDPLAINPSLAPAAAAAVRRCLEKNKAERFQSARDLAFHLQQVEPSIAGPGMRWIRRRALRRNLQILGLVVASMVVTGVVVWFLKLPAPLEFQQLTFHHGRIGGARFSANGIVYSQAIAGAPVQVWRIAPDSPESAPLPYKSADVLSARAGKLALSVNRRFAGGERFLGTLAEVPAGGGSPHEMLGDVEDADWDPAGDQFAVALSAGVGTASRLEYPIGHVLYRSDGSILCPRVSHDGRRVAFLEDPLGVGASGRVLVLDREGKEVLRTRDWDSARGLAWSPRGNELWFTAAVGRNNRALRAVDMRGKERLVLNAPSSLTIWDVAADGRVLLTRDDERRVLMAAAPGETVERDLSWFDDAGLSALSADGTTALFDDRFGIYVRLTNGEPPVRLEAKEAYSDDLSRDGSAVLATPWSADHILLLPTRAAAGTTTAARYAPNPRSLRVPGIKSFSSSLWFPDGRHILFNGREGEHELRAYVLDLEGGPPRPLTSEGTWALSISPDGGLVAATGRDKRITLWPTDGGAAREVPSSKPEDRAVGWSDDGAWLWVFRRDQIPTRVDRLEIATGRRELWKTLAPPDTVGVYSINEVQVTPSGNAYLYSYRRVLAELYLASGLR